MRMLLFIPLLLCSCAKKATQPKIIEEALQCKKIIIEGVECKYCAQAAVSRLEKIADVKRADFVCKSNNWETGYARIFSTKEVHDSVIDQELAKEGFSLKRKSAKPSLVARLPKKHA